MYKFSKGLFVFRRYSMKKKLCVFFVFLALFTTLAFAQLQGTVGVDVMVWGGVQISSPEVSGDTGATALPIKLAFPYAQLAYNFDFGMIDVGVGAKAYTLIIESVMYPLFYADFELGPVVLHAGAGGLLFGLFGIYNDVLSGSVFMPEVGAYFKIGKSFQIGASGIFFMSTEQTIVMPYTVCISGRFVFDLFGSPNKND